MKTDQRASILLVAAPDFWKESDVLNILGKHWCHKPLVASGTLSGSIWYWAEANLATTGRRSRPKPRILIDVCVDRKDTFGDE